METQQLSMLSFLRGDPQPEDYIQPHYREAYRLAVDSLVCGGQDSYQEFLKGERIGSFLSEDELVFITANARQPMAGVNNQTEDVNGSADDKSSTGTYWPVLSDVDTPDLELGWPEVPLDRLQTSIDLLFHPPRLNSPTIKEVIRKHIQDARQVIAIVMDVFTDVDIFKEAVEASIRGVPVYVLLDDFHLQSFLSMAENQGVHIQKLRNMRVRTVKGQEYLCRSGARFNGAMEQRFLLVDCQTVVYGSYSFMWSFEKIHLSMVQVIKGQLVGSYDEEFRTLYARSTMPAVLCPSEGLSDGCRGRGLGKYASQAGQIFERKDQLRHTLDTVYKKACERQMGMREMEDRPSEQQRTIGLPNPGLSVQNRINQFQSMETANFLKRHSYAGERQEGQYIPSQNMRFGASNWNVAGDGGYQGGRMPYSNAVEDYPPQLQGNQMFRSHNIRQSYHGIDKQAVFMKQNMPTLERVSKSFLRTQRIESYLSNTEAPIGEAGDYLDQYELPSESKAGSYMPSRVRSSIVFNSTIPEHPENNSYTNTSSSSMHQTDHSTVPSNGPTPYYSSMQWNPAGAMDSRARQEEFILKRRSLMILDDPRGSKGFGPVRDSHHSIYASLGRAEKGLSLRNPDILQDNWHKRHSVADPKSNIDYRDHRETSSHMYGGFARRQVERSTSGTNAQNGGYGSNLKEDHRSASQYDVKNVPDTKSPPVPMWQEPPSRTVSAAALDVKSTNVASPRTLKNGSKKLRSLLNIPEKKEVLSHSKDRKSPGIGGNSDRPPSELHMDRNHFADDLGKSSAPRFSTEELQQGTPDIALSQRPQQQHTTGQCDERTSLTSGNWRSRDGTTDHRLYSRFEPFCAFDKKPSSLSYTASGSASTHTQVKSKNTLVNKAISASEHHNHVGQPTQGHHENKLGKFIQRVGNFIHKNK